MKKLILIIVIVFVSCGNINRNRDFRKQYSEQIHSYVVKYQQTFNILNNSEYRNENDSIILNK